MSFPSNYDSRDCKIISIRHLSYLTRSSCYLVLASLFAWLLNVNFHKVHDSFTTFLGFILQISDWRDTKKDMILSVIRVFQVCPRNLFEVMCNVIFKIDARDPCCSRHFFWIGISIFLLMIQLFLNFFRVLDTTRKIFNLYRLYFLLDRFFNN